METRLEELVESTRGVQPFRRLFHAGVGVSLAGGLWLLRPSRLEAVTALAFLVAVLVATDLVRLRTPKLNLLFFKTLRALVSPREASGLASSTWYVAGVLVGAILFPLGALVPAILVLALADPAANFLGRKWGKRRLGTGSVEGVVVFTLVATGILVFFASPWTAVAAAAAGALVEVMPWNVDDNLTIPLAVASVLWILPT